jgi:hypothetical protein
MPQTNSGGREEVIHQWNLWSKISLYEYAVVTGTNHEKDTDFNIVFSLVPIIKLNKILISYSHIDSRPADFRGHWSKIMRPNFKSPWIFLNYFSYIIHTFLVEISLAIK